MSIHRTAAKRDGNEREIIDALKAVGASVQPLSAKGCPDLLVGYWNHERTDLTNYLLEVKLPKGKLTDDEQAWHAAWNGQVAIVRTVDDALRAIGAIS